MGSISWFSLSDKNVPEKQDNLCRFQTRACSSQRAWLSVTVFCDTLTIYLGRLMGRRLGAGSVSKESISFLCERVYAYMYVHAHGVLGEPTGSPTPKHALPSSF